MDKKAASFHDLLALLVMLECITYETYAEGHYTYNRLRDRYHDEI
jgi:hypothetical protein